MTKKLWEASGDIKLKSNLFKYEKFLSNNYNYKISKKYSKLLKWTLKNPRKFWSSIWDFANVKGYNKLRFNFSGNIFKHKFLINSKLNFAENLLSKKDDTKALTFISENGFKEYRSWRDLNMITYKVFNFFKSIGVKKSFYKILSKLLILYYS